MGDSGVFAPGERVELIEGDIIPVSPQNNPHAKKIARLNTRLVRIFGDTHEIRVQLPLTLGDYIESNQILHWFDSMPQTRLNDIREKLT